jgi:hypothetical protein
MYTCTIPWQKWMHWNSVKCQEGRWRAAFYQLPWFVKYVNLSTELDWFQVAEPF